MSWLVTGGTGFVGSHFISVAHQRGHDLRVLRRSLNSQTRIELEAKPVWVDCGMDELTVEHFRGVDRVVHLAAHSANVPYDTLENCLHWNVTVPLAMFRTAIAAGVKRFVVAGSCFEYGPAGTRYDLIPTNAPLEATLSYPASKAAASIAFASLAAETGIELSLHRIFQVFGPGEASTRLWPSLKAAALAGEDFECSPGDQIRDFVPVEAVAKQLVHAAENPGVPGQASIDHIGTGKPQSLREFCSWWWSHWDATGTIHYGAKPHRANEVMRFVPDMSSNSFRVD